MRGERFSGNSEKAIGINGGAGKYHERMDREKYIRITEILREV